MIRRSANIPLSNSFFLFGARGTGKTTLLQGLLSDKSPLVIDLLKQGLYRELQANPEKLSKMVLPLKGTGRFVFIDEVQKVPELLDLVHHHIEQDKIRFALTGSSSRKLKRGGANLLAGRAFVFRLFPLIYTEFAESFSLELALRWGTLPKIIQYDNDQERTLYLRSYVETYLAEEIIQEQIVRNIPPFSRFLSVAAQCNSTIVNYSKIAADIQSDASNVRNYFSILEETLLGFLLEPFHLSVRKRQRTSPKFYFIDTGLVRTLSQLIDVPLRPESKEYGSYFESFIINQIRSYLEYQGKQYRLSYLLSGDNAEIDLIVERAGKDTLLIEIKSGTVIHQGSLNTLKRFAKDFPGARLVCLYNGEVKLHEDEVEILPWREVFCEVLA